MNSLSEVIKANHIILRISEKSDAYRLSSDIIKTYWDQDPLVQTGSIFNGTILNLKEFTLIGDSLEIHCNCIEYKYFHISRKHPSLQLPVQPLGVSGIIIGTENGIPYTLFARRSNKVAHYPGFYELVPSGHLDALNTTPQKIVAYKDKLCEELEEETNLSRSTIDTIQECGFIYDKQLDVYDIVCEMTVSLSRQQLAATHVSLDEYVSSSTVSSVEMASFLEKHSDNIIPTSRALAAMFFNGCQ